VAEDLGARRREHGLLPVTPRWPSAQSEFMQTDSHRCPEDRSACPHCAGDARPASDEDNGAAAEGGPLVWWAIAVFLLPLLLALLGALVAGSAGGAQLIGAACGLGLGLLGSILLARWTRRQSGGNA